MRKKSDVEMRRAEITKRIRAYHRLEASLAADRAINDTLPGTLKEFDEAVARGELLAPSRLLSLVAGNE